MLVAGNLIGWWHRRRPAASYGLTMAGRPLGALVGIGVLLWAVAGLLPNVLTVLGGFLDLGVGAEHWVVFDYHWGLGFWFFMAASSFVLVPVYEELFTRGYFQTRLSEDFGPAGGILIASGVFAFSHTQYYRLSVLSLGTLAAAPGEHRRTDREGRPDPATLRERPAAFGLDRPDSMGPSWRIEDVIRHPSEDEPPCAPFSSSPAC